MDDLAYVTDPRRILDHLSREARTERLDFALPLIEAIRVAFALDQTMGNAPPGTLTVQGWLGLLQRWELLLEEMAPRRIHFAVGFFRELLQRGELERLPMGAVLVQLVALMEQVRNDAARQAA